MGNDTVVGMNEWLGIIVRIAGGKPFGEGGSEEIVVRSDKDGCGDSGNAGIVSGLKSAR